MRNKRTITLLFLLSLMSIIILSGTIDISAKMIEITEGAYVSDIIEQSNDIDVQMPKNNILTQDCLPSNYGINTSKSIYDRQRLQLMRGKAFCVIWMAMLQILRVRDTVVIFLSNLLQKKYILI